MADILITVRRGIVEVARLTPDDGDKVYLVDMDEIEVEEPYSWVRVHLPPIEDNPKAIEERQAEYKEEEIKFFENLDTRFPVEKEGGR